ncbi:MAG: GGDEF domain-containing protein [Pseudomonadota bacterium]
MKHLPDASPTLDEDAVDVVAFDIARFCLKLVSCPQEPDNGAALMICREFEQLRSSKSSIVHGELQELLERVFCSIELDVFPSDHIKRLAKEASEILEETSKSILQSRSHFERLANFDSLTQTQNRFSFQKKISELSGFSNNVGLVLFDLDGLKDINSTYGMRAGDMALKAITDSVKRKLREYDFIARIGGDEFVVVLPNVGMPQDLETVVLRLRSDLPRQVAYKEKQFALDASFGFALARGPVSQEGLVAALDDADSMLRNSRRQGAAPK